MSLKVIAAIAALGVAVALLVGYAYLRRRHAAEGASAQLAQMPAADPRQSPKALIMVDEPTLAGGRTTLGGIVKNTSGERLTGLAVELELKRRIGGTPDKKLIPLEPGDLEPQQEGRYSVQLQAADYSYARLAGLRSGPGSDAIAYTTAPGQKRSPERLESKTITVDKPRSAKGDEYLNTPDNPARVP